MRPLSIVFALLLGAAAATRAAADVPALADPPNEVAAGEQVTLQWRGLPAAAREVELELSLDGGRWIRISPELDSRGAAWCWRVPDLPSGAARLRLRYGGEHFEGTTRATGTFRVTGSVASPERRREHAGEWWGALSSAPHGAPGTLRTAGDEISLGVTRNPAEASTALALDTPRERMAPAVRPRALEPAGGTPGSRRPVRVPLRI